MCHDNITNTSYYPYTAETEQLPRTRVGVKLPRPDGFELEATSKSFNRAVFARDQSKMEATDLPNEIQGATDYSRGPQLANDSNGTEKLLSENSPFRYAQREKEQPSQRETEQPSQGGKQQPLQGETEQRVKQQPSKGETEQFPQPKKEQSGSGLDIDPAQKSNDNARSVDYKPQRSQLFENPVGKPDPAFNTAVQDAVRQIEKRIDAKEISAEEAARTYQQVNKLWTHQSEFYDQNTRHNLGLQILTQTGGGRNDQGFNGTCAAASIEKWAYSARPSMTADMIVSTALNGSWTAPDGKSIQLDQNALTPGPQEAKRLPADGERSLASQIFQNLILTEIGQHHNPPEQFVSQRNDEGGPPTELWKRENGETRPFDGLLAHQIAGSMNRLFSQRNFVLDYDNPYEKFLDPFSYETYGGSDGALVGTFRTKAGLVEQLDKLHAGNNFPASIGINQLALESVLHPDKVRELTSAGNVLTDPRLAWALVRSAAGITNHQVTITKYDKANQRVFISNSQGREAEGWLSIDQLWKSV